MEIKESQLKKIYIMMQKKLVKWLKDLGVDNKNIILYGESLGTGVATELAQKIILEDYS